MEYITFESGSKHKVKPSMFLAPWERLEQAKLRLRIFLEFENNGKLRKIADTMTKLTHELAEPTIECKIPRVKETQDSKVLLVLGVRYFRQVFQAESGVRIIPKIKQ